ncbi:MAG: phosphate ABC transporter substrate-binding protein [Cellvibrionaceae bacterium]|nr:phosphate ABC transporter substrate-binding protein [Cellvibrionaceae bacterium]
MKKIIAINLGLLCSVALHCNAEKAVIVHPSNAISLSTQAVKNIYLGRQKSFSGGGHAIAINQKMTAEIRKNFEETILGKSPAQVKAYWSKQLFTGKGVPPQEVDSDKEVIGLVAQNPSTIGYIDSSLVDSSVKVVLTF